MTNLSVLWLFPPSPEKGLPNISQYRFFKYMPVRSSIIYPYLAASGVTQLVERGFHVSFMDCPTENKTMKDVEQTLNHIDVVVLEARTPFMNYIYNLTVKLKTFNKNVKIIVYGDHVSAFPEEALANNFIDYVVVSGDWDIAVTKLCEELQLGSNPARRYGFPLVENLDVLPWVNRELVDWRDYFEAWRNRKNFFWIMSGRGCHYHCVFCSWAKTLWENKVRLRSVEDVAKEYKFLSQIYGDIEVLDDIDLFITDWGVKFSEKLLSYGLTRKDVHWAFQTHPNEIYGSENFHLMHEAGLTTVKLGVESLNQNSLNIMRKATTISQIEKAIIILKENKINVHANVIVGWPWESRSEALHTVEFLKKLDPNQAQFSMLIPYPNTELYEMAKANDWLTVAPGDWQSFNAIQPMLKMKDLSSNEIVDLYQNCWSSFYLNRKYVWKHIKAVRHFSGLMQLFRGFKSIYFGHMKSMKKEN